MYDYDVILSFITAFTLTYFAIPSVIHVAKVKNLVDVPGGRHVHTEVTPSLGGFAIFAGMMFSILLWTPFAQYGGHLQYILCAFVIIFLIGAKDDIVPVAANKKLVGQIFAASILFFKANVQITGVHGILEMKTLPFGVMAVITIFTIIVIINGFNLIDGINGLSGSISTLSGGTLGIWFLLIRRYDLAIIAFSTAGSVIAFLKYNYSPAKIFMGDTGALLIGLVCAILTINFIEINNMLEKSHPWKINAGPAVAFGILIFPLFDTLRVFITRALKGRSPLSPDRNHIHHLLIDSGFSHMRATAILVFINLFFIILVFMMAKYTDTLSLLILVMSVASVMMAGLFYYVSRKNKLKKVKA
mgnify:CR=1 FL=1